MSAPMLTGVTPSSAELAVGQSVRFQVTATDADTRTETWTIVVTDAAGNRSLPAQVPVRFLDALRLEVTGPKGTTATVKLDPADPLAFTITNPG